MALSVVIGYVASVRWNREQIKKDRRQEKKDLFRCINFFVADCRLAMKDAEVNLTKNMPPHRSIPCAGIEYFQVQLMRHMENEMFVSLATLRSVIEQANQPVPAMIQQFTASPTDAIAPENRSSVLQLQCRETLKRYRDIRELCVEIAGRLDARLKEKS